MRDQLSFIQRVAWNFKRTRVNLLVGELENLKSTVQLLVQVLCAARQLHAYKNTSGKSSKRKKEKQRQEAQRQCSRVENVLVDWQRTQENVAILQEAAEKDDQPKDSTLAVIQAAIASANASTSERRALVQHNTANWVDDLLHEWTCSPVEPARNSEESTADPEETSAVLTDYKKQVAELEEKLASVRDENVSQDVDTRTEELVSTSLDAQHEMNLLRDDLTRRVRKFEQTQYTSPENIRTDYNFLTEALEQELPKKLDKIRLPSNQPPLVQQRKSLSHCARKLRESLDEDFARQLLNLIDGKDKDKNGTNRSAMRPAKTYPSMLRRKYEYSRGTVAYLSGNESSEGERFTGNLPGTPGVLPPVIVPLKIFPRMMAECGVKIVKWDRRIVRKDRFMPGGEVQSRIQHRRLYFCIDPNYEYGRKIRFSDIGDMLDDGRTPDVHFILTRLDAPATKGREAVLEDLKAPRPETSKPKKGATADSGTNHYGDPLKAYKLYDDSEPAPPNGDNYSSFVPQYETDPTGKHERKFRYSTAKQGDYYSPLGYPSPRFSKTYPEYLKALIQKKEAREKQKSELQNKGKARTTSGGQEALGKQTREGPKGRSARSAGREPKPSTRRDTEQPERKKAKQMRKREEELL